MQITEFEPLSHHRKLPNLGLHRMRDTKRLFGGPVSPGSSWCRTAERETWAFPDALDSPGYSDVR